MFPLKKLLMRESIKLLSRVLMKDSSFKKRLLTTEILLQHGVLPTYKAFVNNATYYFSRPFQLTNHRVGIVGFIQNNNVLAPRSYYISNSHVLWRYLPDYEIANSGYINKYGKGYSEESVTLPIVLNKILSYIAKTSSLLFLGNDRDLVFLGTVTHIPGKGAFYKEVNPEPYTLIKKRKIKIPPEQIKIKAGLMPNFSLLLDRWQIYTGIYGLVRAYVFPSENHQLRYLFFQDVLHRVWIGRIERDSLIRTMGLNETWVHGGDLTTPAYEYYDQTGGYGNKQLRKGVYVDMYKNYLCKIPVIDQYIKIRTVE